MVCRSARFGRLSRRVRRIFGAARPADYRAATPATVTAAASSIKPQRTSGHPVRSARACRARWPATRRASAAAAPTCGPALSKSLPAGCFLRWKCLMEMPWRQLAGLCSLRRFPERPGGLVPLLETLELWGHVREYGADRRHNRDSSHDVRIPVAVFRGASRSTFEPTVAGASVVDGLHEPRSTDDECSSEPGVTCANYSATIRSVGSRTARSPGSLLITA